MTPRKPVPSPLRAVALGIKTAATLAEASAQFVASAAVTATNVGIKTITAPLHESARAANRQWSELVLGRQCSSNDRRVWIEIRDLDGPHAPRLSTEILKAARTHPGVISAVLNYPLSRLVVELETDPGSAPTPLRTLCGVLDQLESRYGGGKTSHHPLTEIPGDGKLLAQKILTTAANAAGLGIATVGQTLLFPRLPASLVGVVVAVDYQPWFRRLLEDRLGQTTADTVIGLLTTTANTVTFSQPSLAVDLAMNLLKSAESLAGAREWSRREEVLARHADCPDSHQRAAPRRKGSVDRHAEGSAWVQALGSATLGALTQNPAIAGTAASVTAPKGARAARESFAATLGRGLADSHSALPLRPEGLRRLDQIDTLVLDPRVLCSSNLRLSRIRGVEGPDIAAAWHVAQERLAREDLAPGWHRVGAPHNPAEVLVQYAHLPMAAAVIAEARSSGLAIVSVDDSRLGELRSAMDEILPVDGSVDDAIAQATEDLQRDGKSVAVLSSSAAKALSIADLALGIMPSTGELRPPWNSDLILDDLSAAWRVLHAMPAARTASRRGIEIATGASALGALLMLPGVRGRGPEAVTAGAGTGLFTGYWLARKAVRSDAPEPEIVHEWHAMSADQVRALLPQQDLAAPSPGLFERVPSLAAAPGRGLWQFAQAIGTELADPLTPVLSVGAAASAVLGSPVDAVLVSSVLVGNALLAAVQRLHSEQLLDRLLHQQVPPARTVSETDSGTRKYRSVDAKSLRPGDVIEVRPDEVVPADARLIEVYDVEVDESSLTGESLPVEKQLSATPGTELADRRCMLYAGTTVMAGTALAIVTAVEDKTEARRAAALAGDAHQSLGLQHQLSKLTNRALPVSLIGGGLVSGLALFRRTGIREAVSSGVAVAVAAVPEGLPLVATLAQQASARRLTRTGVLVRTPRSVEALGRVDVVCFDKTGTLSENRLRVTQVYTATGVSREAVLLYAGNATPAAHDGRHAHATDAAIAEAAHTAADHTPTPLVHLPFRPGRPFSASVIGDELTVKGAPEVLLAACPDPDSSIEPTVAELAANGLRVIAVARRSLTPEQVRAVQEDSDAVAELCTEQLQVAGLLGLSDTPRPEAARMLAELTQQDIAVRLITGDHPITAAAIARELGLPVTLDQVISGAQWEALSRKDQEQAVADRIVFARMSPENKVQIVQTLERTGRVCAMVGDGANDAAAIRAATVGIGVVSRGSDPAHSAADVVLLDGQVHCLLDALEEGRQLWQRVQAAVSVLLGGNAGEVLFAIAGSAISGRAPLNARQLLLVNMLTDALPAAALAVSRPRVTDNGGMRGPDEEALWQTVAVRGGITATAATSAWLAGRFTGRPTRASTVGLVALVSTQLGQTLLDSHSPLVIATAAGSLGTLAVLVSTPGVSQLLGCTPLGPVGWFQALGAAAGATALAAFAPDSISRWIPVAKLLPLQEDRPSPDQSTIFTTPTRHNNAYNWRNGGVKTSAANPVSGSTAGTSLLDTVTTVTGVSGETEN
ncbi:haloacid dehalogenase [Mycobacteroides franklinii]|uniref:Haloacid dehalogenase n=1 Tax=Mycobacteroides franklinii TaxID=948102 RepID=A0A1S1L9G7_9MYCO|nr:haloacid dehalogenase [Mycobacteroides franklinii]